MRILLDLTDAETAALRSWAAERTGADAAASRAIEKLALALDGGNVVVRRPGLTRRELDALCEAANNADIGAMEEDGFDGDAARRALEKCGITPAT